MANWINNMLGMVSSVATDDRAIERVIDDMAISYLEMILESND